MNGGCRSAVAGSTRSRWSSSNAFAAPTRGKAEPGEDLPASVNGDDDVVDRVVERTPPQPVTEFGDRPRPREGGPAAEPLELRRDRLEVARAGSSDDTRGSARRPATHGNQGGDRRRAGPGCPATRVGQRGSVAALDVHSASTSSARLTSVGTASTRPGCSPPRGVAASCSCACSTSARTTSSPRSSSCLVRRDRCLCRRRSPSVGDAWQDSSLRRGQLPEQPTQGGHLGSGQSVAQQLLGDRGGGDLGVRARSVPAGVRVASAERASRGSDSRSTRPTFSRGTSGRVTAEAVMPSRAARLIRRSRPAGAVGMTRSLRLSPCTPESRESTRRGDRPPRRRPRNGDPGRPAPHEEGGAGAT